MTKSRIFSSPAIAACALVLSTVTFTFYVTTGFTPVSAAQSRTRLTVETLASDAFEGRMTGSNGERLAADFIISELQRIGARPLPGLSDYRLPFEFTAGSRDGGSTIRVSKSSETQEGDAIGGDAVRALSFSENGTAAARLVFAGYGIVVPESQDFGYDSYAGIDVKDKVVLVLRYFPEDADQKTKGILVRYSDLRYKATVARQRGAKALLVVTGPRSPNAGALVPMTFDTALAGSGMIAASVTGAVADTIFRSFDDRGKTLESAQQALDGGNPHVPGFEIPVNISITTEVVRERRTGHNVLAYLPATTPTTDLAKPWIAIGAHYDHLGHGENGNSLSRKEEAGGIHHGADDNASGTAAALGVADALAAGARRRNVLLDFWSGEELGLIGSSAFVAKPSVPLDQIAAYLNFDMVGRMQDNKLSLQAVGSSSIWPRIIEQANVSAGFDLQLQPDPYQPTDVASFYQAGIPSLNFFTGIHPDYHRPTDTAEKIDFDDLDRIVQLGTGIARRINDLADPPAFTKFDRPAQGAGRAGIRVFTGTIPDYSSDAKGLLLSGVIGGGPAEQAGLQKGDLVVEIAGQSITNIYDYTYALELLKVGQPVKVVFMRENKRIETMLTPSARP